MEKWNRISKVKVKKINLIENPIAGYKDKYTIEFEDEDNNKYICNYYGSKIQEFKDAFDNDKTIIMEFLANNMEDLRTKMSFSDFDTLKSIMFIFSYL